MNSFSWYLQTIVMLVSVTLLAGGCTTTRLYPPPGPEAPDTVLQAGDAVELLLRNGDTVALTVIEWQSVSIIGIDDDEQRREIPWADVAALKVTGISAGKTAAALGGTAVLIYAIALTVALLAWGAEY